MNKSLNKASPRPEYGFNIEGWTKALGAYEAERGGQQELALGPDPLP
jgi:hypothetical protein